MTTIDVDCSRDATADAWTCTARLSDGGRFTEHTVSVRPADLERLDPGATEPDDLVRRSFEFLLGREPKESILRSFDLPVIGRYFPEYESEIGRR